jgi:hypothetical protein
VRAVVAQFPSIPSGHAGLALLHADRGRCDEAAAELDLLAADGFAVLPRNPEWLTTMAALAQTSALLPDAPHAATLFAMLAPYRGRTIVAGMGVLCPGSVAHFLGILATRLGRFEDAERCLAEALAAHERIGGVLMCAYTRYEQASLAVARGAPGDEARAAELAAAARRDAEAHGMRRLQRLLAALPVAGGAVAPALDPARDAATAAARAAVFRRDGDNWRLGWNGTEFQLRDRVGLRHLATLLAHPSQELLAVDLVRGRVDLDGHGASTDVAALTAELGRPRTLANAEAALDERAELAYRRRLHELREVIDEARRHHDLGRIAEAEVETDVLTREIARGLGLQSRGRDSRSPIERARISATRAIRIAIRLIQEHDRGLGRHLGVTIKTGTFCSYVPDPEVRVTWSL